MFKPWYLRKGCCVMVGPGRIAAYFMRMKGESGESTVEMARAHEAEPHAAYPTHRMRLGCRSVDVSHGWLVGRPSQIDAWPWRTPPILKQLPPSAISTSFCDTVHTPEWSQWSTPYSTRGVSISFRGVSRSCGQTCVSGLRQNA